MRKIYITIIILLGLSAVFGQTFTAMNAGLTGVDCSSVAWGDYDNDGDLDILLTGYSKPDRISKIYRNDSGVFTDINAGLTGVLFGSAAWGDYDNDGDLDILLTGYNGTTGISKIYRNDSGVFTEINAGLTGVNYGSVAWGDYDNDGDLDILLTGYNGTTGISKIYRNDSGVFTDINAGLTGVYYLSVAWGDYDNDGDLDILFTGSGVSKIYRNDNGVFTDINAGLIGVYRSSVAWGDYDNDGDLDILLTGYSSPVGISKIYRNDSGVFTDINAGLAGVSSSSVAWGDYDNDGDLDILLTGSGVSKIYRNDSGVFTDINAGLAGVSSSSVAWGDYDNDGDLDILLTGYSSSVRISKIYRNDSVVKNTIPSPPTGFASEITSNQVTLTWDKATDLETPQNGLSYNLYIGTSPFTGNKKSPMSDISTGYRKVVGIGNSNKTNSWTVNNLPSGTYNWSVQAVDNAYTGSLFGTENSIVYSSPMPVTPVATPASNIGSNNFIANWSASECTAGYFIDVAADSAFSSYVAGYQNKKVYNSLSMNISDLDYSMTYYYRIRAYNADEVVSGNSNTVSVRTLWMPFTEINAGLTEVGRSSVAWGDYDNDGDLDILLTGHSILGFISKIYRNDSGVFTDINAGFSYYYDEYYGSFNWGDYDNDGDLDILLKGPQNIYIYRNDSGIFTDIDELLPGGGDYSSSSVAWGDYDNDGDLDILLSGLDGSYIERNDSGIFNAGIIAGLPEVLGYGSVAWGDYDNDGDLDIFLSGIESDPISRIYRNDSGVFTDINAGLTGVYYSSVAWGDYDNDGDLDILLTGNSTSGKISKIYRNDSGVFTDINAGLTGVTESSAAWGDCDNDGDLDILLTGISNTGEISKIYRNDSGVFIDINAGLTGVGASSVAWGDYDNDGDLDILLTGSGVSKIYRNDSVLKNTRPASPTGLTAVNTSNQVTLSWDKATDLETPQNGLSYNLYIGTSSLTGNKKSPMSNISTGYRKVVGIGNANKTNSWTVNNLTSGTFYWSVQAVDNAYAGSLFSSEKSFTISSIPQNVNIYYASGQVNITWTDVPGAVSYKIYASEDPFGTFTDVSSQGAFNGASWSQTVSGNRLFYYIVSIAAEKEESEKTVQKNKMLLIK